MDDQMLTVGPPFLTKGGLRRLNAQEHARLIGPLPASGGMHE
jgi:hypothetical protein